MKKVTTLILLFLISLVSFSQSKATKQLLAEIDGQWQLDASDNVTYERVIDLDDLSESTVYNGVLAYFNKNYGNKKSFIKLQDQDLYRIVMEGLYKNVHEEYALFTDETDCRYIVKVDILEGKATVQLTLVDYERRTFDGDIIYDEFNYEVTQNFPVNPKGSQKNLMGEIFYNSHKAAMATMDSIETSINGILDESKKNDR